MDSVYLISLIVGGFFVLLSIFGGSDHEADSDAEADFDHDFEADTDVDVEHDLHVGIDADAGTEVGFVDLLSIRALFLFAAFFGLTGSLFTWFGGSEPLTAMLSVVTGLAVGLGGNYIIKKFAYEQVSSTVTSDHLKGKTGQVVLPFGHNDRGKIVVEANGQRLQLLARPMDADTEAAFEKGEDVVVVRLDGRVAEVIKPN